MHFGKRELWKKKQSLPGGKIMPFPLVWLIPPVVGAIATKAAEKVLTPPPPPPPPPQKK
jgi:hypothetical protein